MKKAVFHWIMALAVVLGLTLAMATPVAADTVDMVLTVDLLWTTQKGTLHYVIEVTNPLTDSASYDVTFYPPGPTGAQGAYGAAVTIDTNRTIAGGDTVTYNWNGEGDAEVRPELRVRLPDIPIDDDVAVVFASAIFDAGSAGVGEKPLPTGVIWPNTEVNIEASEETVSSGDSVTLTITEANTGAANLTNVYVEVRKNGAPFATLDHTHLSWSSDMNGDNVLDVDETWSWAINSGPITSTTTFVALGFGTTALYDLEVSYDKDFLGERHTVTVSTDMPPVGGTAYPISSLALLAPWIVLAGLIAGAAVFVWSRRAQGRA